MSNTGRFTVHDIKTGRTFVVEPIMPGKVRRNEWTDSVDNASGGAIHKSESIITEENGFKNICFGNPMDEISRILNQDKDRFK